ncbi:hypothetical protein DB30_00075 [Enhygromyxa salina]|uniref:Uncharacterized protein n=1 Tax=Enhygromyxa salina TaxID=215803 RepID=A0A0C2D923_9BACT|nr:hypothetical protein [Enhygromyxa salina]KIG19566.1 hypothetical protein DB30_00075 [Enhygromyxa salina]
MSTDATPALDPQTVLAAAKALSGSTGFWFTRRCLMFELCRRRVWPDPGANLAACEQNFAAALASYEQTSGQLERLVRPEQAIAGVGPADLEAHDLPADLFDYAIGRVALFQRMDLCLMLIANGFHREIEVALTVPPEFPSHVWGRIHAQLNTGLRTTFLAIHDYSPASGPWLASIDEQLGGHEAAEVFPIGLTTPWAYRLRIPVRGPQASPGAPSAAAPTDAEPRAGSYALLEELSPLRAMRWIYGHVARGAEDVGFG